MARYQPKRHIVLKKGSPKKTGSKTPTKKEKARESKKKKPMITDMSQDEEIDFSQFAPLPHDATATPDPFVAPSTPPAPPPPARFRMKQLIVRSLTANTANSKDSQAFLFMPASGFKPPRKI